MEHPGDQSYGFRGAAVLMSCRDIVYYMFASVLFISKAR